MKLDQLHTQDFIDILSAIRCYNQKPSSDVFAQMAQSSCGMLFTQSVKFQDRVNAFLCSGYTMDQIFPIVEAKVESLLFA